MKKRKIVERDGKYYTVRGIELEFCSNTMTRSEFFGWIRSAARRLSIRWKPRTDFLMENRRPSQRENKKIKWEYCCNVCKKWYILKDIEVDHKIPVGTLTEFCHIGEFISRLLVEKDGYQILCKQCHNKRTQENRVKL